MGCIIGTSIMYTGNAFISQQFELPLLYKVIFAITLFIFSISMIYLYAPADTEDVPVVSKKERKKRKIISYIIVTVMLIAAVFIKNNIVSNILLVGILLQTISITRFAYKITNNKYGYEEYWKNKNMATN
ncbi:MAG: accessory gene regulator B family protein [Clostridia bacterium]|nr:accessory gene regulator B family protein [Clostridia bacterium]